MGQSKWREHANRRGNPASWGKTGEIPECFTNALVNILKRAFGQGELHAVNRDAAKTPRESGFRLGGANLKQTIAKAPQY
jgi:hypothetical protein